MRHLLFAGLFLSVLFLSPSAFAISYSTSAWLDFSTLSFSGVSISPSSSWGLFQTLFTFMEGNTIGGSKPSWTAETETQNNAQNGEAVAVADLTFMQTSASLIGSSGNLSSFISRNATFDILSSGHLTVSIQYALAQSGILEPAHVGGSFVTMDFVFLSNGIADQLQNHGALAGDSSHTGTLSLTQWFNAGQQATIGLRTASFANSVPVPDMFVLTVSGLVGIAVLARQVKMRAMPS
ncbi:MAG: hypothetical protein K0S45_3985 [Nitrospira sp.]|jgi:hypothetical protein|nr:hypothetical protein [Nitrospira sp.]